jgi:hypothetical protein
VPHTALIEQPDGPLQVLAGGHAEAEMIQAHPVRVETVTAAATGRSPIITLPRIITGRRTRC